MSMNVALLVAIFVVLGIAVLAIVGLLIWLLTKPKQQKPAESERITTAPPEATTDGFLVLRRGPEGWEIYVEGKPYRALVDVPDSERREEVMKALRALAAFARDYVQRRNAGSGSSSPPSTSKAPPDETPPVRASSAESASPKAQSLSMPLNDDPLTRRVTSSTGTIPTIDFAHEIGEIVDDMLARAPSLQGHVVRLNNMPGGGISFAVDGKIYQEIDDIPNPDVRELIRKATREWERR